MSDPDIKQKQLIIFGVDLARNPCMKYSLKYSAPAAVFSTLGFFLLTSNSKKSLGGGLVVGWLTLIGYYHVCTYRQYQAQLFKEEYLRGMSRQVVDVDNDFEEK